MNELLLILGIGLALDFLLSRIIPKRPRPAVHIEESPFGNILVYDEILSESDRKEILEAMDSLNHGPRDEPKILEYTKADFTPLFSHSPITDTESRGLHQ